MSQTETYTFAFWHFSGLWWQLVFTSDPAEGEQNLPGVYFFGVGLADATDITDTLSLKVPWR